MNIKTFCKKGVEKNKDIKRLVLESGNLALEPRDPKSGDFNKGLNRKVPGLVALAKKLPGLPIRFWHSLVATI